MELIKGVRGTKDIYGTTSIKYNYVTENAAKFFDNYGYGMIKTPIFEETALFKRGIGEGTDVVDKEMYTFMDKGDRSITLRPEGTASVVRAYLENKIYGHEEISRFYYIGSMFRYERPQAGRQREFNQIGVEVLGESSPILDAEVIAMSYKFLEKIKITDLELVINSVGGSDSRSRYRNELLKFLKPLEEELCEDCKNRKENNPLRVLDCKNEKCKSLTKDAPSIIDSLDKEEKNHYEELKKYLKIFEINYREDSRLVRGLDYYSGTVYEVITNKLGAQGTVLGGGRYDNLLKQLGDKEIPAFGYAAGVERIMMLLDDFPLNLPKVYIAWVGDESIEVAMKIANELRVSGIKTVVEYSEKSIKAQMKKADKLGVEYTILIGKNEIDNKKYLLKNFKNREQFELTLEEIKERLV
ncbi:MAG: histidine--tRNA ligase [Fusobacteriaceae bacterium]